MFKKGYNTTGSKKKWVTSIKANRNNGLVVEAYVGGVEQLETLFPNRGIHIRVFNYTSHPTFSEGYEAPIGYETNMMFSRTFKEVLPYPFSDCLIDTYANPPTAHDSAIYNLILQSKYSYSQKYCFVQCYQKMVIDKCGCFDLTYDSLFTGIRSCLSLLDINCLNSVHSTYVN